ncbi:hypothetical protein SAMN05445850_8076 [Paraburkholderia tuberum]|uniref:Uncharacterized protein n=1 Tax=Paraburkholderia tuberum TaxID=157910 RepID=A0A1H1KJS8_9BURK|nr:hypothetical protein [Paraburkholderia tuberum]SDR61999.1 hypothetical protein SAMN05445850_8076 [Paraburkholderia tuberum]
MHSERIPTIEAKRQFAETIFRRSLRGLSRSESVTHLAAVFALVAPQISRDSPQSVAPVDGKSIEMFTGADEVPWGIVGHPDS